MTRMIFVNLPVTDLPASRRFYEAIGFTNEPRFSDETAACMVLSDAIFVMLLTHAKWATFTSRPIPSSDVSEVMLCVNCDSRDAVNAMADSAASSGGQIDVNPAQDHGFMMSRTFADPDGHVWEPMWMDPAVANGDGPVAEDAAHHRAS
ncbi:VOC family protein [Novosphingobium lentum]|uniref:VOC family protein n=1 Tax=Novosphingobium lentum TaxID=145287 RepID=UPI00083566BA|nr:VOC family protein [Novosphingobium lentum]